MKKLFFSLFFILVFWSVNFPVYANLNSKPQLIVIDPGHGGIDPGAVNSWVKEKDLNLTASLYLKQSLEKAGAIVTLTRNGDYDLKDLYPGPGSRQFKDIENRKKYIENLNPDFFISIHVNSGNFLKNYFGQVFYGRNLINAEAANIIQASLNKIYNVAKSPQIADFLILSTGTPGVLIEIGFIDDKRLQNSDFLKKLCQEIASSIIKCLNKKKQISQIKGESRLLIVIDDFGNNSDSLVDFLKLKQPFTAAVMPFLNNTHQEAKALYQSGNDIIIHMPMEPKSYKRSWLGPKPIRVNLTPEEITSLLAAALKENPWAIGINNHTGSKACEDEKIVKTVLSFCQKNNLVFIDSQTTPNSLFPLLGSEFGVVVLKRDIFLEVNGRKEKNIIEQLQKLQSIAQKKNLGIAIGHVGYEGGKPTATALKKVLPKLPGQGFKICTLSDLIKKHP